jgi:hypothetical protein
MAAKKGSPRFLEVRNRDTEAANRARGANADEFAAGMLKVLLAHADDLSDLTLKEKAHWLNDHGYSTRLGSKWSATSVARLFERLRNN